MSEEEEIRFKLENKLLMTRSKAQMINLYLNKLDEAYELAKELQQKENIIKEVREYINWRLEEHQDMYKYQMEELLEILDKGE